MAKRKKENLNQSLSFNYHLPLFTEQTDWDAKAGEFVDRFPSPPLIEHRMNTDRINSFCRMVLGSYQNIVFIGREDLITLIHSIGSHFPRNVERRHFYFCDSSSSQPLSELEKTLESEQTVLVFIGSRLDERDLLALSLTQKEKKTIFVGPSMGSLSESARILFVPFFPFDANFLRFWQHSEFAYLPLSAMGCDIAEFESGCEEGFRTLMNQAAAFSLILSELQQKGIEKVNFVVDTTPFNSLVESFFPLLEEGWQSSQQFLDARVFSFPTLKNNYSERFSRSDEKSVFILIHRSPGITDRIISIPPELKKNAYLGPEFFSFQNQSYHSLSETGFRGLTFFLQKKGIPSLTLHYPEHSLFSLGGLMSFFYLFICYNAWLRGNDVLNDPPLTGLDASIWERMESE